MLGRSSSLPRPPKASPDDKGDLFQALACCQSLNLKSSDSFAGADGTEPDHGNSAPLLPEVRQTKALISFAKPDA